MKIQIYLLLLIILIPLSAVAQNESCVLLNDYRVKKVWRVYSNGKVELVLHVPKEPPSGALGYGTTYPVPSPNQGYIAFTRKIDLWLLQLHTKEPFRLTQVEITNKKQYTSAQVFITGWSSDSSKILYYLGHSFTGFPGHSEPTINGTPVKYGFHIYDLGAKLTTPVPIKGQFLAWLPNGDFLLKSKDQLVRTKVTGEKLKPITYLTGDFGQIHVSKEGQWILAKLKNQIIKISTMTGDATPITPVGAWAEYQWPKFSPSAKHIAYLHRTESKIHPSGSGFIAAGFLVVDGRLIYPYTGNDEYNWIDDGTIAIISEKKGSLELTILDSTKGQKKSQHKLGIIAALEMKNQ